MLNKNKFSRLSHYPYEYRNDTFKNILENVEQNKRDISKKQCEYKQFIDKMFKE